MSILAVDSVKVTFGGLAALGGVTFSVEQGEIVGLIGPNGAGKTTLFNCISGLQEIDSGHIRFDGAELQKLPPHKIAKRGVARTFQASRVFKRMTVMEHILVGAHKHQKTWLFGSILRLPGMSREENRVKEHGKEILAMFEDRLLPRLDHFADSLSYANRRRLEIARAMMSGPEDFAARRAHRRDEPARIRGDHRPDLEDPGPRDHGAAHRTRHESDHGRFGPRRGARPRIEDRRRPPRRHPAQRRGRPGVSRQETRRCLN